MALLWSMHSSYSYRSRTRCTEYSKCIRACNVIFIKVWLNVPCVHSCYLSSLGYSIFKLNYTHRCYICPQYSKISVIWIFDKCTITVIKRQPFNYTIIVTNLNRNAHFMLNEFAPVLILCSNSHQLKFYNSWVIRNY